MADTNIHIPTDFERLPEYRVLSDGVGAILASFYVMTLFSDLAYQAESTKVAGFLTDGGMKLFLSRVLREGGAEAGAKADWLKKAEWLKPVPGGWQCERFAKTNEHLVPGHMSFQRKGALASAHVRAQDRIEKEAMGQASLFGPSSYKGKDGALLNEAALKQCIVCIKNLDSVLGRASPRQTREYSEGLMADAAATVERFNAGTLDSIYRWILDKGRTNAQLPKTAEQVLADIETVTRLMMGTL